MSGEAFIPVNVPALNGNEKRYLSECIDSGWISSEGPFVARFEEAMAQRVGRRHAIAVCNGTAALELAVASLGIGPGDEVIVPSFTIISCATAVVRAGATPVFIDCDPDTWNIDAQRVEEAITPRTVAVMAVHVYGLPVPMTELLALADRHGLLVIEDAAQAIGQLCDGRPCGGLGDISVMSFYPNKLVTTGEGGMVLTDDDTLAERCRSLRNLAFGDGWQRFRHEALGWNMRISNLQAALGLAQLERLDQHRVHKKTCGERYRQMLDGCAGLKLPLPVSGSADNDYWVFGVVLDEQLPCATEQLAADLAARGIGTRPFFWPLHDQPALHSMPFRSQGDCPNATRLGKRGLYLPGGVGISVAQVERAAGTLEAYLGSSEYLS